MIYTKLYIKIYIFTYNCLITKILNNRSMQKKLFYVLLVSLTLFLGCKKKFDEITISPIEIGEIKGHIVTAYQAQKIAILHSIYPDHINKISKKKRKIK